MQHLRKSGDFGAYLFQTCVLLLVNVSSVCLGKGFAPLCCTCTVKLLRGCGWAMAAVRPLEHMLGLNFFGANTIYCNTADLDLPCATCIGGTALGTISGS